MDANENWYHQAQEELTSVATAVQEQRGVDLDRLARLAKGIVCALEHSDQLVVEALSSPAGSPLITNLVNVSILASKVGMGLGYYGRELEHLALAGLVHDIGIFAIPQSLLTKAGRLTPDERVLVEHHPELGCRVIEQAGDTYQWLAPIVLQAHERWTGQGYPRQLKGRQIAEIAQIIGVVDIFDALINPRPYRKRLVPHEAIHELVVVERMAFPREVIKALVEQLSVYPLGTTVRMTTGETGVVTRVNPRYPLRPVVRVATSSGDPIPGLGRFVDLSLTPVVSILETIDSPAVNRITFSRQIETPVSVQPPTAAASDQFSALLESLDSIASTIQHVVETKSKADHLDGRAGSTGTATFMTGAPGVDPEFRKEVLGLFALEAREWLGQIQRALRKLEGTPPPHLQEKLVDIILHAITNLGRSAATVQLPAIEEIAVSLVPILQAAGTQGSAPVGAQLSSLRAGLEGISAAVQGVSTESDQRIPSEAREDSTAKARPPNERPHHTNIASSDVVVVSGEARRGVSSISPILESLRALQLVRVRSMEPARDVLEAVIQRAEYELKQSGGSVDVQTIGRILKELDELDQRFLGELETCVPAILRALSVLRSEADESGLSEERLIPILREVDSLYNVAKSVNASTIMLFLDGLRAFMRVAAYRKVSMATRRLEAVESRLGALIPMAEQWVDVGRIERSAIEEILPA